MLGKDAQACQDLLLNVSVKFFVVLREATVQEPQSQ
jgi:hypothetical protein